MTSIPTEPQTTSAYRDPNAAGSGRTGSSGEHGSAAACMDAVALVGRAHATRENELVELSQLMPRERFLGVLLVGS